MRPRRNDTRPLKVHWSICSAYSRESEARWLPRRSRGKLQYSRRRNLQRYRKSRTRDFLSRVPRKNAQWFPLRLPPSRLYIRVSSRFFHAGERRNVDFNETRTIKAVYFFWFVGYTFVWNIIKVINWRARKEMKELSTWANRNPLFYHLSSNSLVYNDILRCIKS